MRNAIKGFALCYLLAVAMFCAAAGRAIPAISTAGALYYGLVWPLWPISVALNTTPPVPVWAFDLSEASRP